MNDLFGEDPYLGQTSYLQSPDGFTQRDKSKQLNCLYIEIARVKRGEKITSH